MSDRKIEVLFSAEQIRRRIAVLCRDIAAEHDRDMLIVPILKGSFIFAADLIRGLHDKGLRPSVDFIFLASYYDKTSSSGEVQLLRDIETEVAGRQVLLIDDILETGRTLHFAMQLMRQRGARSVQSCVLLDKPVRRAAELEADYVGFKCPQLFVVGYGMDLAQHYRELPYIGHILQPEGE